MDPLFFLCQEEYGTYSRPLAHFLKSLNASVLLSELAQRRKYHSSRNELISDDRYGDGWFYMTCEKVEERTYLSRKEQDSALKVLIDNDLIEQKNFGVPAKRHFRLKDDKILAIYGLSKNHSNLPISGKLDCPKRTNCIVPNGQTAHIEKEQLKEKVKREKDPPPEVLFFGHYVHMPKTHYDVLIHDHGEKKIAEYIHRINLYCESSGKTYKGYAATIRSWISKDLEKAINKAVTKRSANDQIPKSLNNDLEARIAQGRIEVHISDFELIHKKSIRDNNPDYAKGYKYKDLNGLWVST